MDFALATIVYGCIYLAVVIVTGIYDVSGPHKGPAGYPHILLGGFVFVVLLIGALFQIALGKEV